MRLSACIEWLFQAEFPDWRARVLACGRAGLDAVEFWRWRGKDLDAIERGLGESGLPLSAFVSEPRGRIVDPGTHDEFVGGVRESLAVARRLGARALIVVTGDALPGVERAAQHAAVVAGLRAAAPLAEDAGVALVLEPLNTRLDHRGYFLDSTVEGLDIVEAVASPAVRLLYDVYHSTMMGETPGVLGERAGLVGHVHVADVPGRHEPGSGTVDWPACLATLRAKGYGGALGLEYRPRGATLASLELARRRLAAP